MTSALLLGSLSTIADTSELQRQAFNDAFAAHDLDWRWDREQYREMLTGNGGRDRIAAYAERTGVEVDADSVHEAKSVRFRELLAGTDLAARPGVAETVRAARGRGLRVALVTTTSRENLTALFEALARTDGPHDGDFDLVVDTTLVAVPKPDPAVYAFALSRLGVDAAGAVAVEDNVGGARAALAAGLRCVAFPNGNTAAHEFPAQVERVERLDPDRLVGLVVDA